MDIGVGLLSAQRRPDDDRSTSDIYDELLAVGEATERAGLDSVWTSEHHFTDDEYLSGTLPALAALSARTEEIELGSAVALAPLYDAVRLAEDAATVQALADGRLALGLSIGYLDQEFENFGVPKDERTDRTEEAIELARRAWEPGPIEYDARFHPIDPETTVTPTPDEAPSVVLGGLAKPAVRRAARMGDGWCANEMLTLDDVKTRQDDIERVREEAGLDGEFTTYVIQYGFVGDSYEEAWETVRDAYFYQQRKYVEWGEQEEIDELPADQREELEERAIVGTPEDVVSQLEAYRETLGDDTHFIFRSYYPGIGTETMTDCIERVGEEVAPHLR